MTNDDYLYLMQQRSQAQPMHRFAGSNGQAAINFYNREEQVFTVSDLITAIKVEREECARVCEKLNEQDSGFPMSALVCAETIRKRNKT